MNKVAQAYKTKTKTSSTVRTTTEVQRDQKPPKGAIIIDNTVSTSTEEIENGWLVTKSFDGRYKMKQDGDSTWFNYTKKWYSETDPVTISVNDKALADAFDDNEPA